MFTVKEKLLPSQSTVVVVVVLPGVIPVISFTVKVAKPSVAALHGPLASLITNLYRVPFVFIPLAPPTPTLFTVNVSDDALVVPDAPIILGHVPIGVQVIPSVLDSH